ncbi:MAG: orotate phosphoribosyltransferase [Kiritimatiellae bacterium]|nr:orotate phosphoribosyltransferase [Kiritimatiellia bacterium]
MTEKQVLKYFEDTGALLSGHFELRSKLHSDRYFQCANVLRYPRIAEKLCKEVTQRAIKSGKLGKKIDGVISPAVGGILVGHEVARVLNVKCVFAEKVPDGDKKDATGKPVTKLAMRRFTLKKGERYVVAEDVVTKGGRVQETIDLVKAAGAKVAGVVLLVDRSAGKVKFGRIPMFSLMQMTPTTWEPAKCPLCAKGSKPCHPGS